MIINVKAGTLLLQEGEVNMDMYKVVSGHCEVYMGYGTDKEVVLGILNPGSFFGELGFFSQKPSIYSVVTYSDVQVERVVMAEFEEYAKNHFSDLMSIIRNMTDCMFNLKFNMNLLVNDMDNMKEKKEDAIMDTDFIKYNLRKYNLMGVRSLSFANTFATEWKV